MPAVIMFDSMMRLDSFTIAAVDIQFVIGPEKPAVDPYHLPPIYKKICI